jgi:hypothetical protein
MIGVLHGLLQWAIRVVPGAAWLSNRIGGRVRLVAPGTVRGAIEPLFDVEYYLLQNEDVRLAGVDPLEHYISSGAREGRDPNADFSTSYYLGANPDVREAGVNPFYHFIVAGRFEGRSSVMPGGFRSRHLAESPALDDVVRADGMSFSPQALISADTLTARVRQRLPADFNRVVVAIGHDDYTTSVGGVQMCMRSEQVEFGLVGVPYIAIYPARPSPILAPTTVDRDQALTVLCNGHDCGTAAATQVCAALCSLMAPGRCSCVLVVHALHGHSTANITWLTSQLAPSEAFFWVHDYFSICPQHNLLRNGVTFCGAPGVSSNACTICSFGEERARHLPRLRAMFGATTFTVVSPSETALQLWLEAAQLPHDATVILPHSNVRLTQSSTRAGPVKVAFLGHPAMHKGWPVFEYLRNRIGADSRYEWYHLGKPDVAAKGLEFREVVPSGGDRAAMIREIRNAEVDIALIWSICPETFCLIAREAVAGGALVVTNSASGALAEFVLHESCGLALEDESELLDAFRSDRIAALVRERHRRVGPLEYSRLTAALIRDTDPQTA